MARSVLHDAIASFKALLFATLSAHWQTLNGSAKVTESAIFLKLLTLVTLHVGVTRVIGNWNGQSILPDFLKPNPVFLCLLALPSLLLRHIPEY